ncbi:LysR family transcriptional regulator [Rhizobium sp. CSW-27]|uniref:LysR family transcriptional regulator n=1 Tax=Rhizobium sp. CSW-27 TaxID=2839985 RepID=UPI00338F7DC3
MIVLLNSLWLQTFVMLCETGHFTRTAQRLNMTQPGVSQHLRKLEGEIGASLIAKEGKRFLLTPAGEAVLAFAQRLQEEEGKLLSSIAVDDPNSGEVTIACSGSVALLLYPRLLSLMADAPDLVIRLEAAPQMRVLEGVIGGSFNFGIVDHPPIHPRLLGEQVGTDELCLVLPAELAGDLNFAELQELGFIGHPDGFAYAEELFAANFRSEFGGAEQLRLRSFINQIGQIPEPVAQGIGYTILPRSGVDPHPKRAMLRCASLPNPVRHSLYLIERKAVVRAARMMRVAEVVKQTLSSGPSGGLAAI